MASVVESIMQPDEPTIKAHLEMLFAPLREEYPHGLIEICYGPDKPNKAQFFNLHKDGIADATTFAASRARAGENIYVGVNPRKPQTKLAHRANDSDVEISIWQFADIDKAASLDGLGKKLRPMPPYYTVDTGTIPHRRPHLYWLLDEPVRNLEQWTQRQSGLAAQLGGDAVINPSRIMRLAGTVNFPPPHKVQRGYRVEVATIKTEFDDEREAVQPELIAAAFPVPFFDHSQNMVNRELAPIPAGQNTLQAMAVGGKTQRLIDAALSGDSWHNNVRDLVARLASLGRSDTEIMLMAPGLTLPGYTVQDTANEMRGLLQSARIKYNIPPPLEEDEERAIEDAEGVFETLSLDQIEDMPPPTYLVDGVLPEHGLTFVYGDPGAGKSFIALDMSLRLAYGMDWHGHEAKQVGVLYIAGEGKHGLGKRVTGWRKEHGLEGVEAPFKLLPVAVHMLDKASVAKLKRTIKAVAAEVGFPISLVVIDTVSRSIPGQDENKQDVMSMFIDGCTDLHSFTDGAVIGVHHSGKDKDKGMRGSTVLLGGCDASIRVSKAGQIVTLKMEKQKDDEEAAPFNMEMKKIEWAAGLTKPLSTLVPFKSEQKGGEQGLGLEAIGKAFVAMDEAWNNGRPLSHRPETRRDGRYAPVIFATRFGGDADAWASHLTGWLQNGCVIYETCDKRTKSKGLCVIEPLGP